VKGPLAVRRRTRDGLPLPMVPLATWISGGGGRLCRRMTMQLLRGRGTVACSKIRSRGLVMHQKCVKLRRMGVVVAAR
jgi:hypothetical protein